MAKQIYNVLVVDNDVDFYGRIREHLTESRAQRHLVRGEALLFVDRVTPEELERSLPRLLPHDLFIIDPGDGPDHFVEEGSDLVTRLLGAGYRAPMIVLLHGASFPINEASLRLMNNKRIQFLQKEHVTAEGLRGTVYDVLGETISVLIVDDDPEEIEITSHLLKRSANHVFHITAADTLTGAVQAISRARFDVVLLDYRLGTARGTELIEKLGQMECPIPVVLTSQYSDVSHDEQALRLLGRRNVNFLSKEQFNEGQLERALFLAAIRPTPAPRAIGHA